MNKIKFHTKTKRERNILIMNKCFDEVLEKKRIDANQTKYHSCTVYNGTKNKCEELMLE